MNKTLKTILSHIPFAKKTATFVVGAGKGFLNQSLADQDKTGSKLLTPHLNGYAYHEDYLQAYADSSWVYSCVSRKAQDAAALPLKLYKKGKDGKGVPVETHPVLGLLDTVNSQMTGYDFKEWLFSSLELTGNLYTRIVDIGTAHPWLLPYIPSLIEPVPSTDAKVIIQKYKYHINNSEIDIPVEEMLHIKYYNPLGSGYVTGMSPLTAARLAYETDDSAQGWNLHKLNGGSALEGALKTENTYFNDKAHRDEAIQSWKEKHHGKNGELVGLLWGGLDWKEFGISPKDMEYLEGRKFSREEILAVYKVPPAVLGLFEYANYANAEQQEKFYWCNGQLPMLRKAESGLNEKFLTKFKGTEGMFFRFDTSGVQVLQDNEDAKSITAKRYFDMGVPYNKVAEALKLPIKDIPGGNVGYLPFSLSPAGQVAEPEPAAEPKPGKLLKHKLSEGQKEIKWNGFIKITNKFEPRVKAAVQKFFSHQELDVLARLETQKSLRREIKIKVDDVLFDPDEDGKKLQGKMKPLYEQIIQKQAQQEIDNFNFSISFDLSNPRVAAWIEEHGLDNATRVNETTRDALRSTLSEGISSGESISDLAKRIADVYLQARGSRADLIARTETIAASNEGALETYRQTGLKIKKGWLSARDELTRDTHIEAGKEYDDAGAISVDSDFYVGAGHGAAPGQIGLPEEDCNCRCSIYPVIEE